MWREVCRASSSLLASSGSVTIKFCTRYFRVREACATKWSVGAVHRIMCGSVNGDWN